MQIVYLVFHISVRLLETKSKNIERWMKKIKTNLNEYVFVVQTLFSNPIKARTWHDKSVVCVDLSKIADDLGARFLDLRMETATGTKLSAQALVRISKLLGLKYIPALMLTPLKAIVVDLDNTLYKGVLGEDGINGIELTEGHKHLQQLLKEKAKEGWFLCVASKNEKQDVIEMFDKRGDFPLQKEDFTAIEASWDDKPTSMQKILKTLNIGVDSVLLVDDNLGEQAQMIARFPNIKALHALDDAELTCNMLSFYPGLLKFGMKAEDAIRSEDVKANAERQQLQSTLSKEDYIRSLEMKLTFNVDVKEYAPRISELANKTNQFIFGYQRYDLPMVEKLMQDKDAVVISVILSDKLSDSGTIAVCVGKKQNDIFLVEECFVSCRALGRGIDDVIVLGMIKLAADELGTSKLEVVFKKGERNTPAANFVKTYLEKYANKVEPMELACDSSLVQIQIVKG